MTKKQNSKPNTKKSAPLSVAQFKSRVLQHINYTLGTHAEGASKEAWWRATCLAVNEVIFERLQSTHRDHIERDVRAVNYLSLEYLMGRLLSDNLHNLNLFPVVDKALAEVGMELPNILEEGPDLALGNGGLGRLAACYLDSLATKELPAIGYGIHYEHGLFKQYFDNGRQVEVPDEWREYGNPWEVCRPESIQKVALYGYVETEHRADGSEKKTWHGATQIKGVPWDVPVVGYNSNTVNILRLWESRSADHLDLAEFNAGAHHDAQRDKVHAETISKILYPGDDSEEGRELRFIQQYFFCACSIKDIVRRYQRKHKDDWSEFTDKVVIQLNDTHPTIAILELMRVLVDDNDVNWFVAWDMCRKIFAYTNHTLLPEALEKWSVNLFERVLPRHLELLYQINEFFLNEEVNKRWPGDMSKRASLSLIEEGQSRMVRMANLCVVTAFKVNGVAEIHSKLVKQDLFPDFAAIWPDKFINVTNGITPRRWLKACNPKLSKLIDTKVKSDWAKNLQDLTALADYADDPKFQRDFMAIKQQNKVALSQTIKELCDVVVDPTAIFDVQIKRMHEYKRQHLNLLHIIALYRRLLANPNDDMHPRVFIFGAKAAPGYYLAKEIIYAINKVGEKINNDERINGKLKVVFLPNYRVSLAEKIIPAADVSEQISTAGKEASGTGNMKLALNGAVTIGTMDGANIEIAEEVGDDNIFIFGHTVDTIKELDQKGYHSSHYYQHNEEIRACLDWLDTDYFTPGSPGELSAIKRSLLDAGDHYKVLADYQAYSDAQKALDKAYKDPARWAKMAVINTARMGKFTSDRAIGDYVDTIWKLEANTKA